MKSTSGKTNVIEFGDFQTPPALAEQATGLIRSLGFRPKTVVEPTCGVGSFVKSSLACFPGSGRVIGADINGAHLDELSSSLTPEEANRTELIHEDFFRVSWEAIFEKSEEPILVIGNPPWVTNSQLGAICGSNLPDKSNFRKMKGFDAISGKSNFDISEWMLTHLLKWLAPKDAVVAMLCKTSVARKVLKYAWTQDINLSHSSMHLVDAKRNFNVAVDSCFLVMRTGERETTKTCDVYSDVSFDKSVSSVGILNGELLADAKRYKSSLFLDGQERLRWRSGIKHDCSRVMELEKSADKYFNGLGVEADIESDFVFPIYKSSDIARGNVKKPRKWVIATQEYVGQNTDRIQNMAPKTWSYLISNSTLMDARKSSIYRKNPRFSVFGIGKYSFAPWKVAVSGLCKSLEFRVLGPVNNKPSMVDDTCYAIPFGTKEQADAVCGMLNSETSREFYNSLIFWDAKRPINIDILKRLDLLELARHSGRKDMVFENHR